MTHIPIPSHLPIEKDVPLAPLTTLGIGGPAQFLARPDHLEELLACLSWQQQYKLPLWIVGGGSNVVIADKGLSGMVLQYHECDKMIVSEQGTSVLVQVGAGHNWDRWVSWCVKEELAGLECLSGIPGFVGTAPIQNIGAYGQELSHSFVCASVLDLETLKIEEWDIERCKFGYRQSAFKQARTGHLMVLSVTFRLERGGEPSLCYPELIREAKKQADEGKVSLSIVRKTVLSLRRGKSMVFDLADQNSHSAGSFFVNPVVSKKTASEVRKKLEPRLDVDQKMPQFDAGENRVKLSAAWLIQHCGFKKGCGYGEVGLSQKHTLALINRNHATAEALLAFAQLIQSHVRSECGILLHPEPILLGFGARRLGDFPSLSFDVLDGL